MDDAWYLALYHIKCPIPIYCWGCLIWSFGQDDTCQFPHCKGTLYPLYLINNLWGGILRPCECCVPKNLLPFSTHWWSLPISITTLGIAKWWFSDYTLSLFFSNEVLLFSNTRDKWIKKKTTHSVLPFSVLSSLFLLMLKLSQIWLWEPIQASFYVLLGTFLLSGTVRCSGITLCTYYLMYLPPQFWNQTFI